MDVPLQTSHRHQLYCSNSKTSQTILEVFHSNPVIPVMPHSSIDFICEQTMGETESFRITGLDTGSAKSKICILLDLVHQVVCLQVIFHFCILTIIVNHSILHVVFHLITIERFNMFKRSAFHPFPGFVRGIYCKRVIVSALFLCSPTLTGSHTFWSQQIIHQQPLCKNRKKLFLNSFWIQTEQSKISERVFCRSFPHEPSSFNVVDRSLAQLYEWNLYLKSWRTFSKLTLGSFLVTYYFE